MNKSDKTIVKESVKLSTVVAIIVLVFVIFSVPLLTIQSLGSLLFPGNGVWKTPSGPSDEIISVPGMKDEVIVIRDEWGIPHIYAKYDEDLFFIQGYLQAQDRYFQMDMFRRQVRGKLSEILGPAALETDKLHLAMGMEYWANKTEQYMRQLNDNFTKRFFRIFDRYVDGINYYLETHKNTKPFEYYLLNFEPEKWSTLDTFCLVQEMARQLSWNYYDLYRYTNLQALGSANYSELFGTILPYQIPVCPNYGSFAKPPTIKTSYMESNQQLRKSILSFLAEIEKIDSERYLIEREDFKGSNNWVVDGTKSATGKPILCNDMHLAWMLPGIWTEQHLVSEESNINSYGFAIPGMPMVAVGHNEHVAWGFTNTGFDVLDWYYYNVVDNEHYIYNGTVTKYQYQNYKINVKGEDVIKFKVKETVNGPVLNDFLGSSIPDNLDKQNIIIASKWTGNEIFLNLLAGYGFNMAKNRNDFDQASENWDTLAQNIVYADIDGNIGIRPTGKVPIRANSNGTFPLNGSKGEGEWIGYIPFDQLPHTENPSQHYLASANQISAGLDYNYSQYFLQNNYADGYRARRINEILNNTDNIDIEIMKQLQFDVNSSAAKAFLPSLIEVLNNFYTSSPPAEVSNALTILENWHYNMDKNLAAPTIYRKWRDYFYDLTFNDEINKYELARGPQLVILEYLMKEQQNSHWFDNVSTTGIKETRNQTMIRAFNLTVKWLTNFYNTNDPNNWKWGLIHQLYFPHLTGLKALSAGPFSGNGEGYTVNPANANIENGVGYAQGGASERMIIDLNNLENSISVIPSGQIGLTNSPHYTDQLTELFLKGKYHSQYFTYTSSNFPSIQITQIFRKAGGM
ncbi:MAG: penicillin acylase family protein [Candidatus Lokiarchaeota archaeon]